MYASSGTALLLFYSIDDYIVTRISIANVTRAHPVWIKSSITRYMNTSMLETNRSNTVSDVTDRIMTICHNVCFI
jgi:hypothetical protein